MGLDLARRAAAERRRGLIWWTVGILSYVGFMIAFWPTVRDQAASFNELMASYPKGMLSLFSGGEAIDFGSPASFLNTYLYASMVPIMVLVLAINFGASAVAGEEERGTLGLVLAYPVRRRSLVLQQALVLAGELAVVGTAVVVTLVVGGRLVDLGPPVGNLVMATVGLALLGLDFGCVALAVGAATGHRAVAAGVAGGLAAATYLVSSMSSLVTWLEPVRWASPFWWATAENPVANGVGPLRLLLLVLVAAVALLLAVVAFERRDLRR